MEWKDLAPWIAIAITMALSILVPLFTQICNNKFQIKHSEQTHNHTKEEYEHKRRIDAYENFMRNVGAAIEQCNDESIRAAGASIGNIYLYVPKSLYTLLDSLFNNLRNFNLGEAEVEYLEIIKQLCELNKSNNDV